MADKIKSIKAREILAQRGLLGLEVTVETEGGAVDCYYEKDIDRYVGLFGPGERTRDEQIALLKKFVDSYPVVSLEDPLHEEDFEGHALATRELGIEVVGDDLFTTNFKRLEQGIALGAANSMVLKISQVGISFS